ncbi:hypothetical protein M1432_01415 [Patescibacteria group bacterium]|nr:hypothetical protein [Patescibacteria group bacterium]
MSDSSLVFRSEKIWRFLANFWTVVFMIFIVGDFVLQNRFEFLTAPLSVIYTGILGLYAATKEFDRWYDMHESRHPGELFVIAWTVVVFGIVIASVVLQDHYHVSSETIAVYIMVLSIFALTQKSKRLHAKKRRSNGKR